jgi:hypothetical protein
MPSRCPFPSMPHARHTLRTLNQQGAAVGQYTLRREGFCNFCENYPWGEARRRQAGLEDSSAASR